MPENDYEYANKFHEYVDIIGSKIVIAGVALVCIGGVAAMIFLLLAPSLGYYPLELAPEGSWC